MADSIANLHIAIRASADKLAGDIVNGMNRAKPAIQARAVALGTLMSTGISAGISKGMEGIKAAFGQAMNASKIAAGFEQTSIAFKTLLGDAGKAEKMLASMRQLAAQSPLEFSDVSEAGKVMLGFGAAAESVLPALRRLGDISLGNGEKFKSLALAFSQTQAAGRLMGGEVLQFINAGFNPLQQIAVKTGESMGELKKRMEDGKVSFQEVEQAIIAATSAGGRFFGATAEGANTFDGSMAKLRDAWTAVQASIGKGINDALKPLINDLSGAMDRIEPQAQAIGKMLGAWGQEIYKGAGGLEGMLRSAVEIAGKILNWKDNFVGFKDLVVSGMQVIMAIFRSVGSTLVGGFMVGKAAAVEMFALIKVKWQEFKADLASLPGKVSKAINSSSTVQAMGGGALGVSLGALGMQEPDLPQGGGTADNALLNPYAGIDYTEYNNAVEEGKVVREEAAKALEEELNGVGAAAEEAYKATVKLFSDPSASTAGAKLVESFDTSVMEAKFTGALKDIKDQASGAWDFVADLYKVKSNDIVKTTTTTAAKTTGIEKAAAAGKVALANEEANARILAQERVADAARAAAQAVAEANKQSADQFRSTNRGAVTDMVTAWATGTGKISDVIAQWSHRMIAQFAELALWGNKGPNGTGGDIGGIIGSLFGGLGSNKSAGVTAGTSSTNGWIQAAGALIGGFFADGGRPPMGKVSVVGENGPELFVPDAAGTIVPNHKIGAVRSGGGGGSSRGGGGEAPIIVNQTFTSGVQHAELAGMMDEMQDRTKAGVLAAVRGGGSYRRGMQS